MCWFVPLIIAGVSAVAQMNANEQAGNAQAAADEFNAGEAEREATIAGMKAGNALERGESERDSYMRNFRQEQGTRAAGQGASGLVMGSGTGADVLADSAALARLEGEKIRHNAAMEVWDHNNQARNATAQAGLSRASALSARKAVKTQSTATLLSAAGSAAGSFK